MLKLLFTLDVPEVPAIQSLHQVVMKAVATPGFNLQSLADQILAESRPLVKQGQLEDAKLLITLHKIRSAEWNVLLVKYKKHPHWYQCEIKKEAPQTTLFA